MLRGYSVMVWVGEEEDEEEEEEEEDETFRTNLRTAQWFQEVIRRSKALFLVHVRLHLKLPETIGRRGDDVRLCQHLFLYLFIVVAL